MQEQRLVQTLDCRLFCAYYHIVIIYLLFKYLSHMEYALHILCIYVSMKYLNFDEFSFLHINIYYHVIKTLAITFRVVRRGTAVGRQGATTGQQNPSRWPLQERSPTPGRFREETTHHAQLKPTYFSYTVTWTKT